MTTHTKRLAIFASGGGSNAEAIIQYFSGSDLAEVALIISNKEEAYVLQRAAKHNIPAQLISKKELRDKNTLLPLLKEHRVDMIILAGFLLLIPEYLVTAYPNSILNIHPALLPAYGGKGMYGNHVHQAVFDNNEKASGMTIHYVDSRYDEGKIIFQAQAELKATDTPDLIAKKVLVLEHEHYPKVIEKLLEGKLGS